MQFSACIFNCEGYGVGYDDITVSGSLDDLKFTAFYTKYVRLLPPDSYWQEQAAKLGALFNFVRLAEVNSEPVFVKFGLRLTSTLVFRAVSVTFAAFMRPYVIMLSVVILTAANDYCSVFQPVFIVMKPSEAFRLLAKPIAKLRVCFIRNGQKHHFPIHLLCTKKNRLMQVMCVTHFNCSLNKK